ncbi:hypothetical protein QQG55_38950 [Brugia pahangi]
MFRDRHYFVHTHNLHVQRREHCGGFRTTRWHHTTIANGKIKTAETVCCGFKCCACINMHAYLCALGRTLWCVASILHA